MPLSPFVNLAGRLFGATKCRLCRQAEPDVTVFPDAAHAASWAGLCSGNCESAGKRLSSRATMWTL